MNTGKAETVLDLVGNTPLVRLRRLPASGAAQVWAKLERFNPGGSVKDRIAKSMIEAAEDAGILEPGDIIVEPTSGNTGIGLAMTAAVKGYGLILVMPEGLSAERSALFRAYGADVVLTPRKSGMKGAITRAEELARRHGHFMPLQFSNPANPEIHRNTTAAEILAQMGKLDAFVGGVGTGGTITGVGEILKDALPGVEIVAVEPAGSPVLSGGSPGKHKIQGIGAGFVPEVLNTNAIDQVMQVTDEDAAETARRLAREEGILAGISSGAAAWAAMQVAQRLGKDKVVVTLLPDTGERYLSTGLFDEPQSGQRDEQKTHKGVSTYTMDRSTERTVYLDHAATTAVDPRVVEAMLPYWTQHYGNASSIYKLGRDAQYAMDRARQKVAEILNCAPKEIVFTSCGSESDNLALRGVAFERRNRARKNHIVTSPIEHHAIGHTVEQLEKHFGFEVTHVPVDQHGLVDPADVERALRPDTAIVSIMFANNEVGTIQPIAQIGEITRARKIPFHSDAVQAAGALALDMKAQSVDLLSLSAHKFYGPKGVGLLYARRGVPFLPVQTGGGHERSRRAGTENVPYIVGLATALELATQELEESNARIAQMRDRLVAGVLERIPDSQLSGHPTQRLPNNASFLFEYIEGESILLNLDMMGVAASSGSACTSGSLEPSHVLTAMGFSHEIAHGSLRLTLGKENTLEEIEYVLEVLPGIVEKLRQISPLVHA